MGYQRIGAGWVVILEARIILDGEEGLRRVLIVEDHGVEATVGAYPAMTRAGRKTQNGVAIRLPTPQRTHGSWWLEVRPQVTPVPTA